MQERIVIMPYRNSKFQTVLNKPIKLYKKVIGIIKARPFYIWFTTNKIGYMLLSFISGMLFAIGVATFLAYRYIEQYQLEIRIIKFLIKLLRSLFS